MLFFNNSILVKDSGLLEGFTDFHCHLLPGVDDGVEKTDETLKILSQWESVGVKEIWFTPHIMEDIPNTSTDLKERFDSFQSIYKGPIKLHLSAENMIDDLFSERLSRKDVLPLTVNANHLLVETSYFNPPFRMDEMLDEVFKLGYFPVLAHPERYVYMDKKDYRRLKDKGILFQLNIPSIVGAYDAVVQAKAEMLLNKGYYEFCGTDTHSLRFVEFFLNSKISKKTVYKILEIPNGR